MTNPKTHRLRLTGIIEGPQGDSAYQVAVQNGFQGTEEEWLASLKGEKGDKGNTGDPAPAEQVNAAVNEYLTQNPVRPTPVDPTLTKPTEAADAKVTGDYIRANTIIDKASGEYIVVSDSANMPIDGLKIFGKSEQVKTTGKNLFSVGMDKTQGVGSTYLYTLKLKPNTNYTLSCDVDRETVASLYFMNTDTFNDGVFKNEPKTSMTGEDGAVKIYVRYFEENGKGINLYQAVLDGVHYIQLEEGESATSYEPYTGGKPSPSPEYPQEILNAGRLNEDTGKYEIDVKVTGKNLIPFPYTAISGNKGTKNGITWEVLTDGGIMLNGTANPETFYLDLHDNLKIGNTLIPPGGTDGRIATNKDVSYDGKISKAYIAVNKGVTVNRVYYPQVEVGAVATTYEPYRKPQTLTLQLDRPLTKWDRLEKREGVWGIVRQSTRKILDETCVIGTYAPHDKEGLECYWIEIKGVYMDFQISLCTHFKNVNQAWINDIGVAPMYSDHKNSSYKYFISDKQTMEEFKAWLVQQKEVGTPVELVYKTAEETWEPLPEETQQVLNILHTNYPTTVVSNNENAYMELSYVADPKNYIDKKLKEFVTVNMQNTANLLSLMPDDVQAVMIENDTNRILESEVVQ